MNKELIKWTGDKEQVQKVMVKAFEELLKLFEITCIEDLMTKEHVIRLSPKEQKDNYSTLWLDYFFQHIHDIKP